MVYGLSPLLRLTSGARTFVSTKEFSLGRLSKPIALLGAMYGAFCNATIALPAFYPQNSNTVNYAPIALAAVIVFALVLYPFATMEKVGWGYRGPAMRTTKPEMAPGESVRAGDVSKMAAAEPEQETPA